MEVKLKAGDSLNIPEGCKEVIKDNVVVFEKEFEEGDVLHSIHTHGFLLTTIVLKREVIYGI